MLVKQHVEVADQMVALLSGLLGSHAFAPFLPCEHRLADVYAAVVDDVGLHHTVAAGAEYARQAVAEQVVAHVAQVRGLLVLGDEYSHHGQWAVGAGLLEAEVAVGSHVAQHSREICRLDDDVEKSFHYIVALHGRLVGGKPIANLLAHSLGSLAGRFHPREYHDSEVPLEFLTCGLGAMLAASASMP